MAELQKLLDQLSQAIQVVLVFVILAGLLVLLASIAASLDQRQHEAALLRALGAQKRQLQWRAGMELLWLGALAGLIAVMINEVLFALLTVKVLEGSVHLHALWWIIVPSLSACLTVSIGLVALRKVWTISPLAVLKAL